MAHTTEIVSYKKLSNGQFALLFRCCNNPSTDYWHTLDNGADRTASIADAHKRCADEHAKAVTASDDAIALMGQTVTHE